MPLNRYSSLQQTDLLTLLSGSTHPHLLSSPHSSDADNYHTLLNRSGGSKTVHQVIAPRLVEPPMLLPPKKYTKSGIHTNSHSKTSGFRLNKFVRRLHDMLAAENESGIVEWRRGLLVLNNTNVFAKQILPKYFNTRNFKTFRRQLNYYGFVHVRSYNNTGTSSSSSTTALWVNRELAASCAARANDGAEPIDNISSVLLLKRVEPCDSAKTAEGRRVRKELAMSTVEEDLGGHVLATSMIHLPQIRSTSEDHRSKLFANNNNDEISSGLLQHIVYQQHQHQPVKVVLEHHNYNTLTSSSRTMTSAPAELSRLSTVRSSRSDSSEGIAAAAPPKQPLSSSTSVANLLLLLSKV